MILIGIGGNLPCEPFGPPRATCGAALQLLDRQGISIEHRARWYESAPVPASDQPWFVNSVVSVSTELDAVSLVSVLLSVESELGRRRTVPNAARSVDLDVLAYNDEIIVPDDSHGISVPHPRLHERAFVLLPLRDICPAWIHPVSGAALKDMIDALPTDQSCRIMADGEGLFGTEWSNG